MEVLNNTFYAIGNIVGVGEFYTKEGSYLPFENATNIPLD